jgi:hypothetical protein
MGRGLVSRYRDDLICRVCGVRHTEPPKPFPDMGKPVGERLAEIFADITVQRPTGSYGQVTAAGHPPDLYREHQADIRGDGTCARCELEAERAQEPDP